MNWVPRNWSRKRIRGLRRHFRHLRQRAKQPSELRLVDLTWLAHSQQTYHQVLADPWLSHEDVPQKPAFRAFWVERFVRTFPHWHLKLKSRYPAFYLAIWLYEPTDEDFRHSRIMVAVNERRRLYENRFGRAHERPLPLEYAAVPGVEALAWTAHARQRAYSPEEFAEEGPELSNRPHQHAVTEQGEPSIVVHFGWIWVGQARHQS